MINRPNRLISITGAYFVRVELVQMPTLRLLVSITGIVHAAVERLRSALSITCKTCWVAVDGTDMDRGMVG
mgnify:CR=1 FL=1